MDQAVMPMAYTWETLINLALQLWLCSIHPDKCQDSISQYAKLVSFKFFPIQPQQSSYHSVLLSEINKSHTIKQQEKLLLSRLLDRIQE